MQEANLTTAQEDMNQILAGLPVQNEFDQGYNPNLDNGPKIPPLTQEEINQIFANIVMSPPITQEEMNRIFESAPSRPLTTEEMNQVFASIPQQQGFSSEEEVNRILSGSVPEVQMNPLPQETQMFENLPQY